MLVKKLKRIGNSIGLLLPRDLVQAADLKAGEEVILTIHGRRIVVEPRTRFASDEEFARASESVLDRHADGFEQMAEYDRSSRRGR